MTTHAPMARVPFSALDSPRLQHLQNTKNRLNGIISSPLSGSQSKLSSAPAKAPAYLNPPQKRRHFDDDLDSENTAPAMLSPSNKRGKGNDSTPMKPASSIPLIKLTSASIFSFSSPPATSDGYTRLKSPSTPRTMAAFSSPRASLTAPAGRSPPRAKRTSESARHRRISAPFMRIEPRSSSRSSTALPFSLDAALAATLPTSKFEPDPEPIADSNLKSVKAMPDNWFFSIHEDTPDEEAANLMEHSTLTLDISSDEEVTKHEARDLGKENLAPADYSDIYASSSSPVAASGIIMSDTAARRRLHITRRRLPRPDDMDDGERSPLSDLDTSDFIPEGLTEGSHAIANPSSEEGLEDTTSNANVFTESIEAVLSAASVAASSALTKLDTPITEEQKAGAGQNSALLQDADDGEKFAIWEDGSPEVETVPTDA